jgi:hypothetical protein
MSMAPEQVEAPAGHAVLFRSSPLRTFAAMAVIMGCTYMVATPLADLALGADDHSWWSTSLQALVLGVLVAAALSLTARASLKTWIRVSDGGIEMAAQGSDPIWLAWPDIASAVVRRNRMRTILEVTPVGLDTVHPVQDAGPGWPSMIDTAGGTAFTADLTQVWPGPRALRRELSRRLPRLQ